MVLHEIWVWIPNFESREGVKNNSKLLSCWISLRFSLDYYELFPDFVISGCARISGLVKIFTDVSLYCKPIKGSIVMRIIRYRDTEETYQLFFCSNCNSSARSFPFSKILNMVSEP